MRPPLVVPALLAALLLAACADDAPRVAVSARAAGRWRTDASLARVIADVADDADVQPGFRDAHGARDTTWCNRGFARVATANGAAIARLYDPDPRTGAPSLEWTSANDLVRNARTAAADPTSGVARVDAATAQTMADAGRSVMAGWQNPAGHGHVATVLPARVPFDDAQGPVVFETGAYVGVRTAREAFPHAYDAVEYFVLPFAP